MSDQEINIAIAEAATNWRLADCLKRFDTISVEWCVTFIKDYTHDLNAMHEAEKTLNETQKMNYREILSCRIGVTIHATARQRAEAFLRTIGKWRDE